MLLKYRDGTEADDDFFDLQEEVQRLYMAEYLGLDTRNDESVKSELVTRMIELRRHKGERALAETLLRMGKN